MSLRFALLLLMASLCSAACILSALPVMRCSAYAATVVRNWKRLCVNLP